MMLKRLNIAILQNERGEWLLDQAVDGCPTMICVRRKEN